jgi:hypothetical protein
LPPGVRFAHDLAQEAQERRLQGIVKFCEPRVRAIRPREILQHVIGADAEEIQLAAQRVEEKRSGGDFDHRADGQGGIMGDAGGGAALLFLADHLFCPQHFVGGGDHGNQHLEPAVRGSANERADLRAKQGFVLGINPHRTITEKGIVLDREV